MENGPPRLIEAAGGIVERETSEGKLIAVVHVKCVESHRVTSYGSVAFLGGFGFVLRRTVTGIMPFLVACETLDFRTTI